VQTDAQQHGSYAISQWSELCGQSSPLNAQEGPLLKLRSPCLFINGERDSLCPPSALAEVQPRMEARAKETLLIEVTRPSMVTDIMSCLQRLQESARCGVPCPYVPGQAGLLDGRRDRAKSTCVCVCLDVR
jgi:hypothetical protein